MDKKIRIGTRESRLAVWQANLVLRQLEASGYPSELVFIKSEGDVDLITPLYAMGVQGVFTRSLDVALLSGRIDLAVHSMKDVPVQLAEGIADCAILSRASAIDVLVYKGDPSFLQDHSGQGTIATSSLRRKAQWLHRYPHHHIDNLRGNVGTRLQKLADNAWNGAIFAGAGLERLDGLPESSLPLDWMLPAPAQGAILVVRRDADAWLENACSEFHDSPTSTCVKVERAFLSALMGGCSTPVGALAELNGDVLHFRGNICSLDGTTCLSVERTVAYRDLAGTTASVALGQDAGQELLSAGADTLVQKLKAHV